MKRSAIALSIIVILLVNTCGCKNISKEPRTKTYYGLFDSFVTVSSYAEDTPEDFSLNCALVYEKLQYFNKLFDIYNSYDEITNLCDVNASAGKVPLKVDTELIDFVEYSIDICKKTDLEINIAMGSVLKLWHDAREAANEGGTPEIPSKSALEDAFSHTNIDSILIDRKNSTIFISDPETRIDVGAIAKGYAAEKCGDLLRTLNVSGYILNLGGNIVTIGTKKNGDGWITGITNPDKNSNESFAAKIKISDVSCVTSGDYERYFTFNGKDYHHIIDKDTLEPATHFSSVTVICKSSALADALSTALFCMPLEAGKKLIEQFESVEVIWIFKDGTLAQTDGIELLAQ